MKQQVPINPALLRWARCAAGLSLKDAAARAKITALRRPKNQTSVTPEDRLASWEDGRTSPSISQLKALANAYRRPFVTFFSQNRLQRWLHWRTIAPFPTPQSKARSLRHSNDVYSSCTASCAPSPKKSRLKPCPL